MTTFHRIGRRDGLDEPDARGIAGGGVDAVTDTTAADHRGNARTDAPRTVRCARQIHGVRI